MTRSAQLTLGLGAGTNPADPIVTLAPGATWLRGFALPTDRTLIEAVSAIAVTAHFRRMRTPGGFTMSAAMTSAGALGWVTDERGYRYSPVDPETGTPWPSMPSAFLDLASRAALAGGFADFVPDSCLVNRYDPGARMTLHRDANERDFSAPIVSVSLGLAMTFLFGGEQRRERPARIPLVHGDVVVWGGAARLRYHGVLELAEGDHPLVGPHRINLTFRKAG